MVKIICQGQVQDRVKKWANELLTSFGDNSDNGDMSIFSEIAIRKRH